MKKCIFLLVLISGCATAMSPAEIEAVNQKIAANTIVLNAVLGYIDKLQKAELLPTPDRLEEKLRLASATEKKPEKK